MIKQPTRSLLVVLWAASLVACSGDKTRTITVNLTSSSVQLLNPFETTGLSKIRVSITDGEAHNDVSYDLGAGTTTAVFEEFVSEKLLRVRVEGYDEISNVVAFGRADAIDMGEEEEITVDVPFRRNLAYITHRANENQDHPEQYLYVIDMATRTLVAKKKLPGTAPYGRKVTSRGGDAMLVTYTDSGRGFLGILSADTDEWSSIELRQPQDLALASPNSNIGVTLGGGYISFVDFDAMSVENFKQPIGGNAIDGVISADGKKAIAVFDAPALIHIDLEQKTARTLSVLNDPSGVAIANDLRIAYAVSSLNGGIAIIDIETEQARELSGAFAGPVTHAVYSDVGEAVLSIYEGTANIGRVLMYATKVGEEGGAAVNVSPETLPFPTGIAADGAGRRAITVAAGSSTTTAGLTIVDTFEELLPEGSKVLYPGDPDDTYPDGPIESRQRYQPISVGVIYGR